MSFYAEMRKGSMCYLCSLRIPPNLVIMRQLKLNAIASARTILEILCVFFIIVYFKKWNSSTIPPLLNFEDSAEFPPLYFSFGTTESQNFWSPTIIEKYRISMIVNNIKILPIVSWRNPENEYIKTTGEMKKKTSNFNLTLVFNFKRIVLSA